MIIKNRVKKELFSKDISLNEVKKKIKHELISLGANNISDQDNIISFSNESDVRSTASLMSKLESGYFEILQEDKKFKICFISYYSIIIEVIIFFISLLMGVFINYAFFIGCIFGILSYVSKYLIVATGCDLLITKI